MPDKTSAQFQPGDKVTARSGKTIWTVLETYRGDRGANLILADGHRRMVAEARQCKLAASRATEGAPVDAAVDAAMVAGIGASIVAAREVGKPDPTDHELYLDLELNGFPGGFGTRDEAFQQAKAAALAALEMGVGALALALFVTSILMWAYAGGAA